MLLLEPIPLYNSGFAFAALRSYFHCFRVPSFVAVRLPSNLLLISRYSDLLAPFWSFRHLFLTFHFNQEF